MRYRDIILQERAASQFYMHATWAENIPSIMKKGLIPNASNNGEGNYTDGRWISLDGVFATNNPNQIEQYVNAHNLEDNYALIVLAVSPSSALPDEDVMEIILKYAYKHIMDMYGIDSHYEDYIGEYFDSREDDPEFELHPDDLQDENDFWKKVGEEFHKNASAGNTNIRYDTEFVSTLVDYWKDFQFDAGGDAHPLDWKDIKDKATRIYRNMPHPKLGVKHSIRIDKAISFRGRNRIVAIIRCIDGGFEVVYGAIPPGAQQMVDQVNP